MTTHDATAHDSELLWRRAGCPHGRDLDFWSAAERLPLLTRFVRQLLALERSGIRLSQLGRDAESIACTLAAIEIPGVVVVDGGEEWVI